MRCPRIVFLEGDPDYRLGLSSYLQSNGLNVTIVKTLNDIYEDQYNQEWAIYLVNFGTNTNRGLEFLKTNARGRQGPVLVLSDSDDPIDRIVCLELGADDGMPKSMHQREILARIRVAARRRPPMQTAPVAFQPPGIPSVAGGPSTAWRFSREDRTLQGPDGTPIDLTSDQFRLMDILITHAGKTLSRAFLTRTLFNRTAKAGDRSIDNLVARLRQRLGEPSRGPRIVRTARAGGYFFAGFPDQFGTKPPRAGNERKRAA